MKLIIGIICLLSSGAFAADDYYVRQTTNELQALRGSLRTLHMDMLRDRSRYAPSVREALERVRTIEGLLAASLDRGGRPGPFQPRPAPAPAPMVTGYYCAAACAKSDGKPDLRYTEGSSAEFEVQAKDLATRKTQNKYGCGYGAMITGCTPVYNNATVTSCSASCAKSDGSNDLRYISIAEANSVVEAMTKARMTTQTAYGCGYGPADIKCSSDVIPTYCTAACSTSAGTPDMRYSFGLKGNNLVLAQAQAMKEVQTKFGCGYGPVIVECSSR